MRRGESCVRNRKDIAIESTNACRIVAIKPMNANLTSISLLLLVGSACLAKQIKLDDGVTYNTHDYTCTNADAKYDFHFRGTNLGGTLAVAMRMCVCVYLGVKHT